MKWWEAPEYDKRAPMDFPDNRGGRTQRVTLKTDTVFDDQGRMRLVNRHPHERMRIFVGPAHF